MNFEVIKTPIVFQCFCVPVRRSLVRRLEAKMYRKIEGIKIMYPSNPFDTFLYFSAKNSETLRVIGMMVVF
jgi:pyruvate/2-oxoglutarate/acetoin dehydrogenase E1 component